MSHFEIPLWRRTIAWQAKPATRFSRCSSYSSCRMGLPGWGIVLIGIAVLARSWGSVFTTGLTIASLVYGPMLGAFLLGVLTKRANQTGVIVGMAASLCFMAMVWYKTSLAW